MSAVQYLFDVTGELYGDFLVKKNIQKLDTQDKKLSTAFKIEDEIAETQHNNAYVAELSNWKKDEIDRKKPSKDLPGWTIRYDYDFHHMEFGAECIVCNKPFHDGAEYHRMPCNHIGCTPCIARWWRWKDIKDCPCCRRKFMVV